MAKLKKKHTILELTLKRCNFEQKYDPFTQLFLANKLLIQGSKIISHKFRNFKLTYKCPIFILAMGYDEI